MLNPASLDGRAGEVVLERLMRPETISIPIPPISFRLSIADSPGKAAALLPFKPLDQAFEDLLIVDGLDKLRRPQIFGRAYTEASPHPATGLTGPHITGRCQHGLRRRDCSLCGSAAPPRRRQPGFHGDIDVFHLLRLVLQPPILDRLAQPGLFPDGRRPYPFQVNGIQWLLDHPEGLLADELGLGKTMQAIVVMRILFRRGDMRQVLVVAPASVGVTWEREIVTWAPELSVVRVQGNPRQRNLQWLTPAEVYIVSYESLVRDMKSSLQARNVPFDLCIADEAQKIKNPATANSRAVREVSGKSRRRWALTGTPLENTTDDAVAIFSFIAPGLRLNPHNWNPQAIRKAISPYLLRRTKKQVDIQFPELRHDLHWLELAPAQRRSYKAAENSGIHELRELGIRATRVHIFGLITSLKLICNYDEVSSESCKLDFLQDRLDEISVSHEKALIFSQYPSKSLSKIANRLDRFKPLRFDGSLSAPQRQKVVDQFQDRNDNDILLMGIRSGGTGITLTRANHVFHFDHWWNPAVVDQGSARVHRIGQQRAVFIHSLYTRDTIEERIHEILSQKRQLFEDVFGELEDGQVVEKLSDEELFGLFGLQVPQSGQSRQPRNTAAFHRFPIRTNG